MKHWITINEPYTHVVHGFALATTRPADDAADDQAVHRGLPAARPRPAVAVYRQQYAPTQRIV